MENKEKLTSPKGGIKAWLGENLKRWGFGNIIWKNLNSDEKVDLPRKNWEIVVVKRSTWELVLWVVVWNNWEKYYVEYTDYRISDEVACKILSEKDLISNETEGNIPQLKWFISDWPDYKMWQEVMIPRTKKDPSKAYIIWYNPRTWEYAVWWFETDERPVTGSVWKSWKPVEGKISIIEPGAKHKILTKGDLDEYNK